MSRFFSIFFMSPPIISLSKCQGLFLIFFKLFFAIRQEKNHFDFVAFFNHFAIIDIRITENAF